jgi:hypothetical protein
MGRFLAANFYSKIGAKKGRALAFGRSAEIDRAFGCELVLGLFFDF